MWNSRVLSPVRGITRYALFRAHATYRSFILACLHYSLLETPLATSSSPPESGAELVVVRHVVDHILYINNVIPSPCGITDSETVRGHPLGSIHKRPETPSVRHFYPSYI